jgi:hypothetical protein
MISHDQLKEIGGKLSKALIIYEAMNMRPYRSPNALRGLTLAVKDLEATLENIEGDYNSQNILREYLLNIGGTSV